MATSQLPQSGVTTLIDKATHSFWPPKPDAPPDNDNIDVQVCDDDDMLNMVNVGSPGQDIKSGASSALDTMMPNDLANEAFKEWISLKVDWSVWLLNE